MLYRMFPGDRYMSIIIKNHEQGAGDLLNE